jgi:hypothetical protein
MPMDRSRELLAPALEFPQPTGIVQEEVSVEVDGKHQSINANTIMIAPLPAIPKAQLDMAKHAKTETIQLIDRSRIG